jgi:hypothetical protein
MPYLVIKTPNSSRICHCKCRFERGSIIIFSEKKWKNILSFFGSIEHFNHENVSDGFLCANYNPNEYVKKCKIIYKMHRCETLKLFKNIQDLHIVFRLLDAVDYYKNISDYELFESDAVMMKTNSYNNKHLDSKIENTKKIFERRPRDKPIDQLTKSEIDNELEYYFNKRLNK